MMANPDIIYRSTFTQTFCGGISINLSEERHPIIMMPMFKIEDMKNFMGEKIDFYCKDLIKIYLSELFKMDYGINKGGAY